MTSRPGAPVGPGAEESTVVGRDGVLEQVRRSLSDGDTVLLEGPAGIGKTAVWHQLVGDARRDGWLVLGCAPSEVEADLPLAALADLLRPLADRVPTLPAPQRVAIEAAALSGHPGEQIDERVLGAATRSLLDAAVAGADGTPVLVAVDDAHWLDRPSERALRFALRRAVPRPAVLVTCRSGDGMPPAPPLGLDQEPMAAALRRIDLHPLGVGALHHILRRRLGATLSRPLLARIVHDAGGNPLLAIELARAVLRLPNLPAPGEDLPVAASLQHLLADVLAELPEASRAAVRLAALLAAPTVRDLTSAGVSLSSFDAAEEAGSSRWGGTRSSSPIPFTPGRSAPGSHLAYAVSSIASLPPSSPATTSAHTIWRSARQRWTPTWRVHSRTRPTGVGPGARRSSPPSCSSGLPNSRHPSTPPNAACTGWRRPDAASTPATTPRPGRRPTRSPTTMTASCGRRRCCCARPWHGWPTTSTPRRARPNVGWRPYPRTAHSPGASTPT